MLRRRPIRRAHEENVAMVLRLCQQRITTRTRRLWDVRERAYDEALRDQRLEARIAVAASEERSVVSNPATSEWACWVGNYTQG